MYKQTDCRACRHAFTMVEAVMVIVVLGIVASIGAEMIANVYKNYLLQRATYRAGLKTEIAAQQIANYLSYRMPGTTLARNPNNLADNVKVTDPTYLTDINHTMLVWIGVDNDSFSAQITPGWSGFADVDPSSGAAISTPASRLSTADTVISNLSNAEVSLGGPQYPAIFFRNSHYRQTPGILYQVLSDDKTTGCMGLVDNNTSCISFVGRYGNTLLTFQAPSSGRSNKVIAEHYKLAWTAYAIAPFKKDANGNYTGPCTETDIQNKRNCDLIMFYNFQPWHGENLGSAGTLNINAAHHSVLATNVSVFKFAESGGTFRFKLCAQENIGEDYNVTICKEKAIIQ